MANLLKTCVSCQFATDACFSVQKITKELEYSRLMLLQRCEPRSEPGKIFVGIPHNNHIRTGLFGTVIEFLSALRTGRSQKTQERCFASLPDNSLLLHCFDWEKDANQFISGSLLGFPILKSMALHSCEEQHLFQIQHGLEGRL